MSRAPRFVHRLVCACCGAHTEYSLHTKPKSELVIPPSAKMAGWNSKAGRVECPRCSEKGPGHEPAPWQSQLATIHILPNAKGTPMADKPVTLREPTQQERIKVRQVLDQHFDDEAGCWLNGYSDQKAGEEIGVPWAMVTRIREAAYGPIRIDPETAALKMEIAQIGRELAALSEKHQAAMKRLDALAAKKAAA